MLNGWAPALTLDWSGIGWSLAESVLVLGVLALGLRRPASHRAHFWSLAALLVVAGIQGILTLGAPAVWIGTVAGWVAALRLAGLIALLALGRQHSHSGVRIALAALVVLSTGLIGLLPAPPQVQPVWPLTVQPSLVTIREDADFRREAIEALLALGCGLAAMVAGCVVRRVRWAMLALGAVIVWFAVPHLDLLVIQAYPTSFYRSPTGFAAAAIVAGDALYPRQCASCHGADGRGDGPAAGGLAVPPADLTQRHLWAHSDGELFWWLTHGIDGPERGLAMPGFANTLDDGQRWALIDYIRAHNAGNEMATAGLWTVPVRGPDFVVTCGGAAPTRLRALQGHVVRLIFGHAAKDAAIGLPADAPARPVTITVGTADPGASGCMADAPDISTAYAIVSGLQPADLSGTQFLIDPDGWLRDMQRPGLAENGLPPDRWRDPAVLLADIRNICSHPIIPKEITHASSQ